MLTHPTLDKLQTSFSMAKAYEEQLKTEDISRLTFDDRLGLMVDGRTQNGQRAV